MSGVAGGGSSGLDGSRSDSSSGQTSLSASSLPRHLGKFTSSAGQAYTIVEGENQLVTLIEILSHPSNPSEQIPPFLTPQRYAFLTPATLLSQFTNAVSQVHALHDELVRLASSSLKDLMQGKDLIIFTVAEVLALKAHRRLAVQLGSYCTSPTSRSPLFALSFSCFEALFSRAVSNLGMGTLSFFPPRCFPRFPANVGPYPTLNTALANEVDVFLYLSVKKLSIDAITEIIANYRGFVRTLLDSPSVPVKLDSSPTGWLNPPAVRFRLAWFTWKNWKENERITSPLWMDNCLPVLSYSFMYSVVLAHLVETGLQSAEMESVWIPLFEQMGHSVEMNGYPFSSVPEQLMRAFAFSALFFRFFSVSLVPVADLALYLWPDMMPCSRSFFGLESTDCLNLTEAVVKEFAGYLIPSLLHLKAYHARSVKSLATIQQDLTAKGIFQKCIGASSELQFENKRYMLDTANSPLFLPTWAYSFLSGTGSNELKKFLQEVKKGIILNWTKRNFSAPDSFCKDGRVHLFFKPAEGSRGVLCGHSANPVEQESLMLRILLEGKCDVIIQPFAPEYKLSEYRVFLQPNGQPFSVLLTVETRIRDEPIYELHEVPPPAQDSIFSSSSVSGVFYGSAVIHSKLDAFLKRASSITSRALRASSLVRLDLYYDRTLDDFYLGEITAGIDTLLFATAQSSPILLDSSCWLFRFLCQKLLPSSFPAAAGAPAAPSSAAVFEAAQRLYSNSYEHALVASCVKASEPARKRPASPVIEQQKKKKKKSSQSNLTSQQLAAFSATAHTISQFRNWISSPSFSSEDERVLDAFLFQSGQEVCQCLANGNCMFEAIVCACVNHDPVIDLRGLLGLSQDTQIITQHQFRLAVAAALEANLDALYYMVPGSDEFVGRYLKDKERHMTTLECVQELKKNGVYRIQWGAADSNDATDLGDFLIAFIAVTYQLKIRVLARGNMNALEFGDAETPESRAILLSYVGEHYQCTKFIGVDHYLTFPEFRSQDSDASVASHPMVEEVVEGAANQSLTQSQTGMDESQ